MLETTENGRYYIYNLEREVDATGIWRGTLEDGGCGVFAIPIHYKEAVCFSIISQSTLSLDVSSIGTCENSGWEVDDNNSAN